MFHPLNKRKRSVNIFSPWKEKRRENRTRMKKKGEDSKMQKINPFFKSQKERKKERKKRMISILINRKKKRQTIHKDITRKKKPQKTNIGRTDHPRFMVDSFFFFFLYSVSHYVLLPLFFPPSKKKGGKKAFLSKHIRKCGGLSHLPRIKRKP